MSTKDLIKKREVEFNLHISHVVVDVGVGKVAGAVEEEAGEEEEEADLEVLQVNHYDHHQVLENSASAVA